MERTSEPERYQRIKALFGRAHALPGVERSAMLDVECAGDPALRAEVEELLRHAGLAADGFLDGDPRQLVHLVPQLRPTISGYRIIAPIGDGGAGVVYRAEQLATRREVAIKVLRLDSLGSSQVARFRREAEVLARCSHPGIAKVLTAGTEETGAGLLPWIAMELVTGVDLAQHLRATSPGARAIVELFVAICDAVEHAHAQGIVHRDLKPSNVMIDQQGRPKVLDFGIARTMRDQREAFEHTRTGLVLGTLAYMSPEQARGDGRAVGPSGDVYALGVMLFEALTGALPVELRASDLLESVRLVCEAEPRRPSQLAPGLASDLETILLKALEKDPRRRYASAGALGLDLSNWRSLRPIVARRAGRLYRATRFVQRHRALTAGAVVVVGALTTGLVLALGGLRAERDSRTRWSAELNDLATKIFDLTPWLGFGEEQRGGLEEVARRVDAQLEVDPRNRGLQSLRARALVELMILDLVRGEPALAEARGHAARALLEGLTAGDPSDLESWTRLSALYARLGEARRGLGDHVGRDSWFRRALALDERLVRDHPEDGDLREDLGWSLCRMIAGAVEAGEIELVRQYCERRHADALALYAAEPDNWKYVLNLSNSYGFTAKVHRQSGDLEAARRDAEEGVRLAGRLLELQRGRRDFVQAYVSAGRIAALVCEALGDERGALQHAKLCFARASELFMGDPTRRLHAQHAAAAAEDMHRLASALGDEDCLQRLRSRLEDAIGLASLARAGHACLGPLEAVALRIEEGRALPVGDWTF